MYEVFKYIKYIKKQYHGCVHLAAIMDIVLIYYHLYNMVFPGATASKFSRHYGCYATTAKHVRIFCSGAKDLSRYLWSMCFHP